MFSFSEGTSPDSGLEEISGTGLVAIIVLLAILNSGCGASVTPTERNPGNSAELLFHEEDLNLGAVSGNDAATVVYPFSVKGSGIVKITAFQKSCGCLSVGEELLGRALIAGQEYKLSVQVDIRAKTLFKKKIFVVTDTGKQFVLTVSGLHESLPKPDPERIVCEYSKANSQLPTGTFSTHRIRHQTTPPLLPIAKEFRKGNLVVSFERQTSVRVGESAENEIIDWKWGLEAPPAEDRIEVIRIPWCDFLGRETVVTFHIVQKPLVHGMVKELFCGSLDRGGSWQHNLTLYIPDDHPAGQLVGCTPTAEFIDVKVKRTAPLTVLHFDVTAPSEPGAIDERVELRFANSTDTTESIRIFGVVRAVSGR